MQFISVKYLMRVYFIDVIAINIYESNQQDALYRLI